MAVDKEKLIGMAKRIARKLFPAYFAMLLLLSGGWLAVTFLGTPATPASASFEIPVTEAAHAPTKAEHSDTHAADSHAAAKPPDAPDAHANHDAGHEKATAAQDAHHDGHGAADSHSADAHSVKPEETATHAKDDPTPVAAKIQPPTPSHGLTEKVGQGYLPRIASDGTTPLEAYAGAAPKGKEPKIAIVIGHLGISAAMVKDVENLLPAQITLAFSPYAPDLDTLVRTARQRGHEVMIELPMEPEDYPDNDAGPYTLLTENSSLINLQHLTWVMTRAGGYTGLTNAQGENFLADKNGMTAVMKFLARRGLMFFESGNYTKSKAGAIAGITGLAYAKADIAIDKQLTPRSIDKQLAELITLAKRHGSARAYTAPYPLVIDRLNAWMRTLKGKGVVLAPVSAVVSHHKP